MITDRYSDPHWQLERKLADMIGEKRTLQREIQQITAKIYDLNVQIESTKTELLKVGEPS